MSYAQRIASCRRVRNPDMEKMGELLEKMKGGRSYTQYAKDVGAAASSLTRIVNGEANKVSEKLLAGLLDNMAPDCEVTFEEVMDANGMVEDKARADKQNRLRYLKTARRIIGYDLGRKQKSALATDDRLSYKTGFGNYTLDYLIETNAFEVNNFLWAFTMLSSQGDREDADGSFTTTCRKANRILGGIMAEFYLGTQIKKWSLVLDNREAFDSVRESILERLKDKTIHDQISIILLNLEKEYVEDEWYLPANPEYPGVFPLEPEPEDAVEYETDDD